MHASGNKRVENGKSTPRRVIAGVLSPEARLTNEVLLTIDALPSLRHRRPVCIPVCDVAEVSRRTRGD